jgi:hypothetical protein
MMKKVLLASLVGAATLLGLSSAQNAMVDHSLKLNLMMGKTPLEMGKSYKTPAGASFTVELLKFYTSNVQLVKADGDSQMATGLSLTTFLAPGIEENQPSSSQVLQGGQVLNAKASQGATFFALKAPAGDYKGLRFEVGVPKDLNHRDASTMPMPLGLESGMFWAWNPGYIFMRLEGKVLVDGKQQPWLLHMGTDNWRMSINQFDLATNKIKITVDGKSSTTLNFDLEKVFSKGPSGAATWDLTNQAQRIMHGGANVGQAYSNLLGAWGLQ